MPLFQTIKPPDFPESQISPGSFLMTFGLAVVAYLAGLASSRRRRAIAIVTGDQVTDVVEAYTTVVLDVFAHFDWYI